MEDTASLAQLLLDWDDARAPASAGVPGGSREELLDFLGELRAAPFDAPPRDENIEATAPQVALSRSTLCRRRQREEIQRLGEEVAALEVQYERLREAKRPRSDESDVVEVERPTSGVWARIARHQEELKRKAERENAKLRGLLDEHSKLAQRIARAIHNRTLEAQTKQAVGKERHQAVSMLQATATERWNATAASPQWQHILHTVFHNDSLWIKERARGLRLNTSTNADGDTVIETVFAQVFPFDLAKTSEALWRCYSSRCIPLPGGSFSVTSASDKLLAAEIQATVDVSGKSVMVESDVLIHKLHEAPDRVVFVWENWSPADEGYMKSPGAGSIEDTSAIKVRMTLDVCVAIEQLPLDGDDAGPASVMRLYSVSSHRSDSILENPIRVSRDEIIQAYHDSNRRFNDLVETYLLDDALGLGSTLRA